MRPTILSLLAPALLASALLPAAARAQQALFTVNGSAMGGEFGRAVANAGDINNDSFDDVIVGAPYDDSAGENAGRIRVYSGKDGTQLYTKTGGAPGDLFGFSVAGLFRDGDGDGFDDVIVGAPGADPNGTSSGMYRLYSGPSGTQVGGADGTVAGSSFGWSVAFAGSVAGVPRVIIGAPNDGSAGAAYLHFWSGSLIHKFTGTQANESFGWSVAGGADINGDNVSDVVIGSPNFDDGGSNTGRAKVFSISGTFSNWQTQPGAGPGHRFGYSVAVLADANGDGDADYVVGAPYASIGGSESGVAYVHSGANGAILDTITGFVAGDHAGWSVASAGDINGDGRTDIVIGAPDHDGPFFSAVGQVKVFSGANGAGLKTFNGFQSGERCGASVSGGGDVNNDGVPDYLAGSPGQSTDGTNAGRAFVRNGAGITTLYTFEGDASGDTFGNSVAGIGDVNADGYPDVLVGAPTANHIFMIIFPLTEYEADRGSARVVSGKDGSTLDSVWGDDAGDGLGFSVAAAGDTNLDGIPDYVVGAPQQSAPGGAPGYARLCSGANGATLFTFTGLTNGDDFGFSVAGGGDVNADGRPDVLVGAPGVNTDDGTVRVYSGATGVNITPGLWGFPGALNERYGAAVAFLGDLNGDGKSEALVGAPSNDAIASNAGRAYVMSTTNGLVLYTISGSAPGDGTGTSVAGPGDLNGDGIRDFVVGSPFFDGAFSTNGGRFQAFSGASGGLLWGIGGSNDDVIGYSVAGVGDADLDGRPDVAAGALEVVLFSSVDTGYASVHSGANGSMIVTTKGDASADLFGFSVAGAGDVDQDGLPDLVVGAPGSDTEGTGAGAARILSLRPLGVAFYGTGTPGCAGPQRLTTNKVPRVGTSTFAFTSNHAPASSLGLLLVANGQNLAGYDPLALGCLFHVDLFASTFFTGLDMNSNASGFGFGPAPIPNNPAFAGITLFAQTLWVETACALPPFNLSTTTGVAYTIQP